MNLDPKLIKRGDMFLESEYGMIIYGIALEDCKVDEENNYWTFDAFMTDGRVVAYGGSIKGSAYNPDIRSVGLFEKASFDLTKLMEHLNAKQ